MTCERGQKSNKRGFSILEVMIASVVLAFIFLATIGLIKGHNMLQKKTQDQSIMLSFMKQYIENARNKPFADIKYNTPINTLYDGAHSAPLIKFPANSTAWNSLDTTAFKTFHPDLTWFQGRNPMFKCSITSVAASGPSNISKKIISMEVMWDQPIKASKKDSLIFTTIVYSDYR